jgi:hypothetical protein
MVVKHEFYLINNIIRCVFFLYIVNLIAHGISVIFFLAVGPKLCVKATMRREWPRLELCSGSKADFANKNRDE